MTVTALRTLRGGLTGLLLLAAVACATAPAAPPPPDVSGTYSGTVAVAGQPSLFGNLRITQTGPDLSMVFTFPEIGVQAEGSGTAAEEGFQGEIEYVLQCPGVAVLEGRIEEDGRVLAGALTATDCEGTMEGTFRFTRRD